MPPLHHQVVTAPLASASRARPRATRSGVARGARSATLDERYEPTPAGLGVTVAWGLPYFRRYVPRPAEQHLPVDRRASHQAERARAALLDAIRFPSDPDDDDPRGERRRGPAPQRPARPHRGRGPKSLFDGLDGLFDVTSIRKGFAGGGFDGGHGPAEADGDRRRRSRAPT